MQEKCIWAKKLFYWLKKQMQVQNNFWKIVEKYNISLKINSNLLNIEGSTFASMKNKLLFKQ